MTSATTTSFLSRNLACLGERNTELAELLAAAPNASNLEFFDTPDGVPAAVLNGRQLCSRHRPLEEARRLVEDIDLVEHAAVVVLGFGLGYHVRRLAERSAKATLLIVFEPDLALLRAAFEQVDHSSWMGEALLLIITDANDRGVLAKKLEGAESILAQGVHFLEHLPSRTRLQNDSQQFSSVFTEFISAAKTTLITTLMRSVDTTRNLMLNLDHYAAGEGIAPLKNFAAGKPAVIVSAGPSLQKNVRLLSCNGVRDRCVIIAVQTTLKPLLAAGIKPHFVTALDYHEISKRFYEDLVHDDLRDVTLIADPKAHPVILDAYPGPIRCCANGFLDKFLGPLKQPKGDLPAGATVAHLAMYLARFLGCDPIAMIGQDLGFTDGLYYAPAPGIAIHDVWAPELNPFNTIEMMEWQRIVRHRTHLRKLKDVHGKSIYTDLQMHTYLQQFERDFAQYKREGVTIVDATEGGVAKQHTVVMTLQDFLDRHAASSAVLPAIPQPAMNLDARRIQEARRRIRDVRGEVHRLRDASNSTAVLLREMLEHQHDQTLMSANFQRIESHRKDVEKQFETFELLNALNQLGVFKRMKADRRLHMQDKMNPVARQRAQLERDLANVTWISDAADEFLTQLEQSEKRLAKTSRPTEHNDDAERLRGAVVSRQSTARASATKSVAALMAIDPERNGLGLPRSLATQFNGKTVLQATLERIGESKRLNSIVLVVPRDFDVHQLINPDNVKIPIDVEASEADVFGPERRAIAAARLWAPSCWRGGIAGVSIYDELLCPATMLPIMQKRNIDAALIVGPDWPFVQVTESGGCDDVIARYLEHPEQHNLVFTQAPPGLCGCLVSATLMQELAIRNRLSTIGGLLVYQPHAPQGDPIARDVNVQIQHPVRHALVRATFDSTRQQQLLQNASPDENANAIVQTIARAQRELTIPRHVVLELCTDRVSFGRFRRHPRGRIARTQLPLKTAERIFSQLREFNVDDIVLTLDGVGDPLLHPHWNEIIAMAKLSGLAGIHVRTALLADRSMLECLLEGKIDVISVDLNADRAATYLKMMGADRFKEVLLNIEYLVERRQRLTNHAPTAAFALPWIVPHMQRCSETYEDIDSFFDRWQHTLGCAVVEGILPFDSDPDLAPAVIPKQAVIRDAMQRMTIFADGSVPVDEWDWACAKSAGNVNEDSIQSVWSRLVSCRKEMFSVTR